MQIRNIHANYFTERFSLIVKSFSILVIALLFGVSGCVFMPLVRIRGLEPVSPYNYYGNADVESLQPEFEWKPSDVDGASYDFAIWRAYPNPGTPGTHSWGELVYIVEDLKINKHTIGVTLHPSTIYCWSVRERRIKDNYLGPWSGSNRWEAYAVIQNAPFYFKTPKISKVP